MNKYEINIIFNKSLTEDTLAAAIKKYTDLIVKNGGNVVNADKGALKKFAYPIDYHKEGYYVLINFEGDANIPAELTRVMNIDESVHRSLCLNKTV